MDISDWRQKIDEVDKELVKLLNERARYADEIGKLKRERNMPIYVPEREEQVIQNVTEHNPGPLSNDAIRRLYERIIDESRRLERELVEQLNRKREDEEKRKSELGGSFI
jgi:chorismate mutase-like protein